MLHITTLQSICETEGTDPREMTWGCQAGVETANLTTVMKNYKIIPTETYESIKLGIDAHV